jgi:hypothetical protein
MSAAKRPKRSFGTIRPMRSGRYQVAYTDTNTGTRRLAPHTFERRNDAEAWLADQHREIEDAVRRRRYNEWDGHSKARELGLAAANLAATTISESFDPAGYFVYLLWGNDPDTPIYVGKSTNILARLGAHMLDGEKRPVTRRVQLFRCETADVMDDTELLLIRHYRPPFNQLGLPGGAP